jgi:hypothetical protein
MRSGDPFGAHLLGHGVVLEFGPTRRPQSRSLAWNDARKGHQGELQLSRHPESPQLFVGKLEGGAEGLEYELIVDGARAVDPYARALPHGVQGPAQVVAVPARQNAKRRVDLDRAKCFTSFPWGHPRRKAVLLRRRSA